MPVALFNLIETQHSKTKIQTQETFFLPVAQKRVLKYLNRIKLFKVQRQQVRETTCHVVEKKETKVMRKRQQRRNRAPRGHRCKELNEMELRQQKDVWSFSVLDAVFQLRACAL